MGFSTQIKWTRFYGYNNTIINNDLSIYADYSFAIYNSGSGETAAEISGNSIIADYDAYGIYGNGLNIHNNTISGTGDLGIDIVGFAEHSLIENNEIIISGAGVRVANYANIVMHYNLVNSGNTALEIHDNAGGLFSNNTFVGDSNSIQFFFSSLSCKNSNNIFSIGNII